MNLKLVFLLVLFGISITSYSQTNFQKQIGGGGAPNQSVKGLVGVSDGYIMAGSQYDATTGYDMWITKTGLDGNIIWSKTYGSAADEKANDIIKTSDNGFVLVGYSRGFITAGTDSFNICVVKTDANGVLLWSRIYGGASADIGYGVKETSDGGLIICGNTRGFGIGEESMYVLRTDAIGNLVWARPFGSIASDSAFAVAETSNGDFVIAGHSNSSGNGILAQVTKFSGSGDLIWAKQYDFSDSNFNKHRLVYDIIENTDGDYVICGRKGSEPIMNSTQPFLLKLNPSGLGIWVRLFSMNSGKSGANSVRQTSDNGYLLGGFMSRTATLIKTGNDGKRQWGKCYTPFTGPEVKIQAAIETSDEGYLMAGNINEATGSSAYLIKTNFIGANLCNSCFVAGGGTETDSLITTHTVTPQVSPETSHQSSVALTTAIVIPIVSTICDVSNTVEPIAKTSVNIYPNPTVENVTINFSNPSKTNVSLHVYDAKGALVRTLFGIFANQIEVERNNLPVGLYHFHLFTSQQFIASGKFILE